MGLEANRRFSLSHNQVSFNREPGRDSDADDGTPSCCPLAQLNGSLT
jgi:hypothetical protein